MQCRYLSYERQRNAAGRGIGSDFSVMPVQTWTTPATIRRPVLKVIYAKCIIKRNVTRFTEVIKIFFFATSFSLWSIQRKSSLDTFILRNLFPERSLRVDCVNSALGVNIALAYYRRCPAATGGDATQGSKGPAAWREAIIMESKRGSRVSRGLRII